MGSPTYKYRPDFKPGSEPCRIQIFSRARSRATPGNFYVRSKFQGPSANDITVQSTWYTGSNGTGSPTTDMLSVNSVVLTVTHPDFATEIYIASMSYDDIDLEWDPDGITSIKGQLYNESALVESKTDTKGNASLVDHMPYFSTTSLSGASGYPSPPGPSIRTGPERSLILLKSEEHPNGAGGKSIDAMLEWNGFKWIEYKEE